tara:strand:- start:1145 stop:1570 length:426 start_codon:yes stop_codon:yes gene_type:complete
MKNTFYSFYTIAVLLGFTSEASAHFGVPVGAGSLHIMIDLSHIIGFIVMGIISGLHIQLFGRRIFVWVIMVPFVLLMSHAHDPILDWNGLRFAMGFFSTGLMIAIATAELTRKAVALIEQTIEAKERRTDAKPSRTFSSFD